MTASVAATIHSWSSTRNVEPRPSSERPQRQRESLLRRQHDQRPQKLIPRHQKGHDAERGDGRYLGTEGYPFRTEGQQRIILKILPRTIHTIGLDDG